MQWFLRLPQWARITIALAIAGGMFILIWQMAKQREAAEPVWHPKAKMWNSVPLTVSWDEHLWDDHNESFERAAADLNAAAGCQLLRVALAEGPTDVRILSANGQPCGAGEALVDDPTHAAQTYLCPDGSAEVHISQPGDITMSYLIAQHELGHALGLAHDGRYVTGEDAPMFVSVMTPNVAEHAGRLGAGKRLPALSDKDAAALRERYCR